jgi:cadmium resistance protein CadD (predicted permease)
MSALYLKALGLWLVLLGLAIACGAFREKVWVPRLRELTAHQLGTLAVCAIFLVVIYLFVARTSPTSQQAHRLGMMWLLLTVLFEFVFGRYVLRQPWARLLADYNLLKGRIWILVLATVALGPWLIQIIMRKL